MSFIQVTEKVNIPEKVLIPDRSPHQSSAIHLPALKVDKTSNSLVSIVLKTHWLF